MVIKIEKERESGLKLLDGSEHICIRMPRNNEQSMFMTFQDCIRCCQEQIEQAVAANVQSQQQPSGTESTVSQYPSSSAVAKTANGVTVELPTTPTDIREVHPDWHLSTVFILLLYVYMVAQDNDVAVYLTTCVDVGKKCTTCTTFKTTTATGLMKIFEFCLYFYFALARKFWIVGLTL